MANYNLISPCENCPFRSDIRPFISAARARDILSSDGEFHCHKTIDYGEDSDGEETATTTKKTQVCAGFLICLEHDDAPNQMMRIAERIGLYDRTKLRMDAPVYKGVREAIKAHKRGFR